MGGIIAQSTYTSWYNIIVYTAKAKPDRPLVNGKTGQELVWEWLDKHGIRQNIKDVTYIKPNAVAYIDDKGIRFESWKQIKGVLSE